MCFSQCPPLRGGPMITVVAMINNIREQQGEGWVLGIPSHRMVTATLNSPEDTVPQIGKINRLRKGCARIQTNPKARHGEPRFLSNQGRKNPHELCDF